MDFAKEIVLTFLEKVFDEPKKKREGLVEYEFNCISKKCSNDIDKYNLNYNVDKQMFNCWKCGYKGHISKLLKNHGSKDDYEILSSVIKDIKKEIKIEEISDIKKEVSFPDSFQYLDKAPNSFHKQNALNYLEKRGIGTVEIKKYRLGFTTEGKYRFRIVVPSFDKNGNLNYFDARSFYPNIKPSYMKPDASIVKKSEIIFNEQSVSFNVPIFLVEGVFDMFPIYNSIPLLGKKINSVLLNKIIKNKTPVVLCLDEDAASDVLYIYYILNGFNIDVYWCPIKSDLAEVFEIYGKSGIVETLSKIKKIDLKAQIELKMLIKENEACEHVDISKEELQKEWELIKKSLKN
jgi:hypothetical protein